MHVNRARDALLLHAPVPISVENESLLEVNLLLFCQFSLHLFGYSDDVRYHVYCENIDRVLLYIYHVQSFLSV